MDQPEPADAVISEHLEGGDDITPFLQENVVGKNVREAYICYESQRAGSRKFMVVLTAETEIVESK